MLYDELILDAAAKGDEAQVRLALEQGAMINCTNIAGSTPLICAVVGGHLNVVQILIAHNADLEHRTGNGLSALHQAASWERVEIVVALLNAGAEVDSATENATTPLMFAATRGNLPIVRMLIKRGANPNASYPGGWYVWDSAIEKGHDDVAAYLVDAGAIPRSTDTL